MDRRSADDESAARGRHWIALILAAVGLAILLLWLVRSTHPGKASAETDTPAADEVRPTGTGDEADQRPLPDRPAGRREPEPPAAPVIDEVTLEKPDVCEGEENLVTVKAHDPGGRDDALHCLIYGDAGCSVPVRLWPNTEDHDAPPPSIEVFGDNGAVTRIPIPPYQVHKCEPTVTMRLTHQLLPNATGEFRFEATLVALAPPGREPPKKIANQDFHPTRYVWDFGDGRSETTATGWVEHSYEFRAQATAYSSYLVTVQAVDDHGKALASRHALDIMNPAYEELHQKGLVKIMSYATPRFPVIENGRVQQVVRLWHFQPDPIKVSRILAYYYGRDGKDLGSAPVPAADLLATDSIPPGAGLGIRVVLDTDDNPEISYITYDIQGTTPQGWPAMGTFSIMRPPDLPTREHNIPVTDPMLTAKILRARQLLGKEYVTDEDIARLERDGKFKGLKPVPVPAGDGTPQPKPQDPNAEPPDGQ